MKKMQYETSYCIFFWIDLFKIVGSAAGAISVRAISLGTEGMLLVILLAALVAIRLNGEEAVIPTVKRHQLLVIPALNNLPVLQNHDHIGGCGTGQTVGNEDGGLVLAQAVELVIDLLLCQGVKRGGGLVKNEDLGIGVEGTGNGKLLPLTAG